MLDNLWVTKQKAIGNYRDKVRLVRNLDVFSLQTQL